MYEYKKIQHKYKLANGKYNKMQKNDLMVNMIPQKCLMTNIRKYKKKTMRNVGNTNKLLMTNIGIHKKWPIANIRTHKKINGKYKKQKQMTTVRHEKTQTKN